MRCPGSFAPTCDEPREHLERAIVLADAPVEVGEAGEDLLVALAAGLELGEELQRARAVAALHERLALLEDELRVVRGRADERLVLGDRLVELALRLEDADHLEAEIDVLRVDRERLLVGLEGLRAVAGLLVESAEEREALKVVRVLVLDLLDEDRELLIGAVDLGDGLVDLGANGGLLAGGLERLLQRGERLLVLVRLRLRLAEVLQRRRERAVVAGCAALTRSLNSASALSYSARWKSSRASSPFTGRLVGCALTSC